MRSMMCRGTGWGLERWKRMGKIWGRSWGDHGEIMGASGDIMGIWCQLDMDMMVNGLVWGYRLDFSHKNWLGFSADLVWNQDWEERNGPWELKCVIWREVELVECISSSKHHETDYWLFHGECGKTQDKPFTKTDHKRLGFQPSPNGSCSWHWV